MPAGHAKLLNQRLERKTWAGFWCWLGILGWLGSAGTGSLRAQMVLFDNTKAEQAGNADWIIDNTFPVPSPSITGITTNSTETYWTGALSSWGVALAKLWKAGKISLTGNGLESLPSSGRITYGDPSNTQDLSKYKVLVICEPNILFTAAEKTAILNFVRMGGGLFMVADHTGSDRNNDGYDSVDVWNDLFTNNSVQNLPFGFSFNVDATTPSSVTVDSASTNPVTRGLAGNVTSLKYADGCTLTVHDSSVCHAAVWSGSASSKAMLVYGTYGLGRFVAVGDSSVVEDSTNSGGTTYDGWTTPVSNGYAALNGTVWLLDNLILPLVTTGTATGLSTNAATLGGAVNPQGQSTTARFLYGTTTNYGSSVTVGGTLGGTNSTNVSAGVSGLSWGATYHFTLQASNGAGTVQGADTTFTTWTPVQAWRQQWFGTTNNSGVSADTNVVGGDGLANLLKYALGLSPQQNAAPVWWGGISNGYLRFSVPKNAGALDVSYRLESTGDLTNGWGTNAVVIETNTTNLLAGRDTNPVAVAARRFMRLVVSRP